MRHACSSSCIIPLKSDQIGSRFYVVDEVTSRLVRVRYMYAYMKYEQRLGLPLDIEAYL